MTFDATVGGATANSYLTVAAADEYASADVGPLVDAWASPSDEVKERILQRATREVDAFLRSSGNTRYTADQPLLYPRAVDVSATVPYIPTAIKLATWAQAKYLNANAKILDAAATRRARGMDSASEPNVSYSQGASAGLLSEEAQGHLQGAFAGGATIHSVIIGTSYSYPRVGGDTSELLP